MNISIFQATTFNWNRAKLTNYMEFSILFNNDMQKCIYLKLGDVRTPLLHRATRLQRP